MRPKHLAIRLSKLKPHPCSEVILEQYATEGDLAAYWMLAIDQLDGVEGKTILDLGAGNGILGIACLALGAKHVHFVECDEAALKVLRTNLESLTEEGDDWTVHETFIGRDEWTVPEVELVVMNPPWGVQKAKADRPFIETALASSCDAIHLLHNRNSKHIGGMVRDAGWKYEHIMATNFRLPAMYTHHSKRSSETEVLCWRIHRPGDSRLPSDEDQ
ncbi:MAG TPA: METTL5 family protein [Poseidonia sp.]|nr:METTL5 family protein [Poseidonia sp.]